MKVNEYKLIYNVNTEVTRTRIFGTDFVQKNKNKCEIIFNNKIYDLREYFDESLNDNKSQIEFILKTVDLDDMSYMFDKCTSLLSMSYYGELEEEEEDININNDLYNEKLLYESPLITDNNSFPKETKRIESIFSYCF